MKRLVCLVLVLMVCLTPCVLAEEITFRGIPWGSSMAEVEEALNLERLYVYSEDHPGKWEYVHNQYSIYGIPGYCSAWSAQSFSDELTVAGYSAYPSVYCVYGLAENGEVLRAKEDSVFYLGGYAFDVIDSRATFDDLKEKLTSVYGVGTETVEYDEVYRVSSTGSGVSSGVYNKETRCVAWYGENNTGVKLCGVFSDNEAVGNGENYVSVWYGKTDMNDYLDELQAAIHGEMVEAENASRSTSIDGL